MKIDSKLRGSRWDLYKRSNISLRVIKNTALQSLPCLPLSRVTHRSPVILQFVFTTTSGCPLGAAQPRQACPGRLATLLPVLLSMYVEILKQ